MTYTFPYDRLKLSVVAMFSTLMLTLTAGLFSLMIVGRGEAAELMAAATGPLPAWSGTTAMAATAMLLSGGLLVTAARLLLREGPVLTIDEAGIYDRRVERRIPWTAVRAVSLRGRGLRATIAVRVYLPAHDDRRRGWMRRLPRLLRPVPGPEVLVNVGALSCRPLDVAMAIQACGGYPVIDARQGSRAATRA